MAWEIKLHRSITRTRRSLPVQIRQRFDAWLTLVRADGPQALRAVPGFRDESLRGDWEGYRSSRLNQQYRVIYKVVADEIVVYVIDVTAHDYRRR